VDWWCVAEGCQDQTKANGGVSRQLASHQ
jgi:hypothetical protein